MIKQMVEDEAEAYKWFSPGLKTQTPLGYWTHRWQTKENIAQNVSDKIWKLLRNLDVLPMKLPTLHDELYNLVWSGSQDLLQHYCRCEMDVLMSTGCKCAGE